MANMVHDKDSEGQTWEDDKGGDQEEWSGKKLSTRSRAMRENHRVTSTSTL